MRSPAGLRLAFATHAVAPCAHLRHALIQGDAGCCMSSSGITLHASGSTLLYTSLHTADHWCCWLKTVHTPGNPLLLLSYVASAAPCPTSRSMTPCILPGCRRPCSGPTPSPGAPQPPSWLPWWPSTALVFWALQHRTAPLQSCVVALSRCTGLLLGTTALQVAGWPAASLGL